MGDIGDNRASRKFATVYRVSLGAGKRTVRAPAYRLVYPKRRGHDAESLFADRQGRLYVVTKAFFGGAVYRAPMRLSRTRPNRLQPVGRVSEFATDAALMRDGRHLLVRGYDSAGVYTFPSLRRVGDFTLPAQRQGEGISVGPGDRIRLSSEGLHSVVREVALPSALVRLREPAARVSQGVTQSDCLADAEPLGVRIAERRTSRCGARLDERAVPAELVALVHPGGDRARGDRDRYWPAAPV